MEDRDIVDAEEFLIEWEGFSIFQCTWEPKTHIPCHILQDYKVGVVSLSEDNIRYVSDQFLSAIQQRLSRRTGAHFYLEIPLSTHRQLFGTDGDLRDFLFNKEDFHKFLFVSNTWDEFIYSKHDKPKSISSSYECLSDDEKEKYGKVQQGMAREILSPKV
uniref:Chromo domain-containing protein n=1 Tax=Magallana gigas TaxID=29159 RepID=A0A8W8JHR6_MAGGI